MTTHTDIAGLQIAPVLADFVETRLLPGLPLGAEQFWSGFHGLLTELMPENRRLLAVPRRDAGADRCLAGGASWQRLGQRCLAGISAQIGYIQPEGPHFHSCDHPHPTPRSLPSPGRSLWCR